MSRTPIHSDDAPSAIGTYSQAMRTGNLVFLSGQIPLDPATMTVVEGDFAARAHRVFQNLKAVADAAGASLDHTHTQLVAMPIIPKRVIEEIEGARKYYDFKERCIFLTDLANFATVNEVMAEYYNQPYPARAAVGVASLPKGVDIEAEAILAL